MDGRGEPQHRRLSQPPNMMMGHGHGHNHNSYTTGGDLNSPLINHNSGQMMSPNAIFPFNSMVPQPQAMMMDAGLAVGGGFDDGSSASLRFNMEPAKKKRGRPRKYAPDGGNISLGLSSTPIGGAADSSGGGGTVNGGGGGAASEAPSKRNRGRPPGSRKKQLDALGGAGVGFIPHVINVLAGEDIAAKILAFSQEGPRTVCILSASGAIGNVTLRQAAGHLGGTVTYEGRFEIIALSGCFLFNEDNGHPSRTHSLSVLLAGSDGQVLGGGVTGVLIAASPVHVIVGSFIADTKKNSAASKFVPSPASAPSTMNFSAPVQRASPSYQGISSGSSDDSGGGSPINQGPGLQFHDATQEPLSNMQMYHQLWASQQ